MLMSLVLDVCFPDSPLPSNDGNGQSEALGLLKLSGKTKKNFFIVFFQCNFLGNIAEKKIQSTGFVY